MKSRVDRLEVFLDDDRAPIRILLRPPFKFQFETRSLPRGRHVLRVVTRHSDGRREERRIPFRTEDVPCIFFEGLHFDGSRIDADPAPPVRARPPPRRWPLVALLFLVGAALWTFGRSPAAPAEPPRIGSAATRLPGQTRSEPRPEAEGCSRFASSCAACHGPEAQGRPGAGPLLDERHLPGDVEELAAVLERHLSHRMRGQETGLSPEEARCLLELLQQAADGANERTAGSRDD